ncbi:MAG: hypothetical protein K2F79_03515, partial [Muribaculaceae bacterium]|nr:hypothetical protein [Muribaculaceae bacterium]
MLGHLMEWLFGSVGGIRVDPDEGCRHLIIRPMPVGDLTSASTSVTTPFGEAACKWEITEGRRKIKVTVPPNSTAKVILPDYDGSVVTDFGKPARIKSDGTINVGSGIYLFEY